VCVPLSSTKMNTSGLVRIEALSKDNYDSWKMQMEALLIKNDAWSYVNGNRPKPERIIGDSASEAAVMNWLERDSKAKSDLILSISASKLKQIKGCQTSRDVWLKLESIYQSKDPARKATLLKRLTLQKMETGSDVRDHMAKFFDAVDKLAEMDVVIHPDLLSVMLLYSLSVTFDNFRCAIESRDELPTPETLRVKILEESEARKNEAPCNSSQDALAAEKKAGLKKQNLEKIGRDRKNSLRCYECGKAGHKASECSISKKRCAKDKEKVSLYARYDRNSETALQVSKDNLWCIDSGCTSHLCKDKDAFTKLGDKDTERINLASNSSTAICGKGKVAFSTDVAGRTKDIEMNEVLFVSDLRTNLMSVAKITDRNLLVTFDRNKAKIYDRKGKVKLIATRKDNLYYIHENSKHNCRIASNQNDALETWHYRLGHLNIRDLRHAIRSERYELITSMSSRATGGSNSLRTVVYLDYL